MADSTRTRRELARVLFSRLIGMILILAVVVAVVYVSTRLSPARYVSKSRLRASPIGGLGTEAERATLRERLSLFIVLQRELIISDAVIAKALMNLDESSKGKGKKKAKSLDDFIQTNTHRISEVRRAIRVETPGGGDATFTQVYSVSVQWAEDRPWTQWSSEDTRKAAATTAKRFTGFLLDAYQRRREQIEEKQTEAIAKKKQEIAVKQTKADLDKASEALTTYVTKSIGTNLGQVQTMLSGIGGNMGLEDVRTTATLRRDDLLATIKGLQVLQVAVAEELKKTTEQVVVPTVILKANPSMIKLAEAIAMLRMELNRLRPRYTNEYKTIRETEAELAANIKDLNDALAREKADLDNTIAEKEAALGHQQGVIKDTGDKIEALAAKAAEYQTLKQEVDTLRSVYEKRLDEASKLAGQAALAKDPTVIAVLDKPSMPDYLRPHRPRLWLNMVIGVLAGLVLSLTYAFVADHLDHSVSSIGDVEKCAGVPVLTSVPKIGKIIRTR